jgi:nitrogen-specific signal transduction histidine kinase/CheY-like chemotaxis protein
MVQDITERIEAQREQNKLQRQLQQAQKMEAIGQLTGGIAHDFNNILASILGYAQLASEHLLPPGSEKLANALKEINRGGKRAEHLVAQMLDFSRGRPLEPEATQVGAVLNEVIEMAGATIPSSIRIEQHLEGNLPSVMANPVQLHQVLLNLLINARDAMEGKGSITINVTYGERLAACDSCHEEFSGEYVEISIRDSAGSLSQDVLERVFDPFFTTKPVGRGTGMGLSMVHGILHDWGGHIAVSLAPGEGTTFHLYIPVHEKRGDSGEGIGPTQKNGVEETPRAEREAGHVLLVDDEETVGLFVEELLKIHGYEVSLFSDSRQAVEAFTQSPNNYDVLLTDQTMPHMTGVELIAAIHAVRPELPVILSSGFSEQVNEGNAAEFGIDTYLAKPMESKKLFAALDALLARGAGNNG